MPWRATLGGNTSLSFSSAGVLQVVKCVTLLASSIAIVASLYTSIPGAPHTLVHDSVHSHCAIVTSTLW